MWIIYIFIADTDKIVIKNISEEVLDELNDRYWKKEGITTMTVNDSASDKGSAKRNLFKFTIGASAEVILSFLLGIFLYIKKYPISYSVFVIGCSIPQLIFIIYYFRKEWRRITKDNNESISREQWVWFNGGTLLEL